MLVLHMIQTKYLCIFNYEILLENFTKKSLLMIFLCFVTWYNGKLLRSYLGSKFEPWL